MVTDYNGLTPRLFITSKGNGRYVASKLQYGSLRIDKVDKTSRNSTEFIPLSGNAIKSSIVTSSITDPSPFTVYRHSSVRDDANK